MRGAWGQNPTDSENGDKDDYANGFAGAQRGTMSGVAGGVL